MLSHLQEQFRINLSSSAFEALGEIPRPIYKDVDQVVEKDVDQVVEVVHHPGLARKVALAADGGD